MEEKKTKVGFWSEYFKSLAVHPLRTIVITALVVDGITSVAGYIWPDEE